MSEETDKLTDADYIDMEVQVEYQRLLDSPDELEALEAMLEKEGEPLTVEQISAEAMRLTLRQDSSTDDQD